MASSNRASANSFTLHRSFFGDADTAKVLAVCQKPSLQSNCHMFRRVGGLSPSELLGRINELLTP